MADNKAAKLWAINVASFVLFILLSVTGFVNWFCLPRGYEAGRGSFLVSLRHLLVEVHEWIAVMFLVVVAIHLFLHWGYIKTNLRKYGILK